MALVTILICLLNICHGNELSQGWDQWTKQYGAWYFDNNQLKLADNPNDAKIVMKNDQWYNTDTLVIEYTFSLNLQDDPIYNSYMGIEIFDEWRSSECHSIWFGIYRKNGYLYCSYEVDSGNDDAYDDYPIPFAENSYYNFTIERGNSNNYTVYLNNIFVYTYTNNYYGLLNNGFSGYIAFWARYTGVNVTSLTMSGAKQTVPTMNLDYCASNSIPSPSTSPTQLPTKTPTKSPTKFPSLYPSNIPTNNPSNFPTNIPSNDPSKSPTNEPTPTPNMISTTPYPSIVPTVNPTSNPTSDSTANPTSNPTQLPIKPSILTTFATALAIQSRNIGGGFGWYNLFLYMIAPICACLCLCILLIIAYIIWTRETKEQIVDPQMEEMIYSNTGISAMEIQKVEMRNKNISNDSDSISSESSVVYINMNKNNNIKPRLDAQSNEQSLIGDMDTLDAVIEKSINDIDQFDVAKDPEIVGDDDLTTDGNTKHAKQGFVENTEGRYEEEIDAKLEDDEFVVESFNQTETAIGDTLSHTSI